MKKFFQKHARKLATIGMFAVFVMGVGVVNVHHVVAADPLGAAGRTNTGAAGSANGAPVTGPGESALTNDGAPGDILAGGLLYPIYKTIEAVLYLVIEILGFVLGLVGVLLDKIIQVSIIDLSKNLTAITSINIAWRLIRDLCNMSFIFILIYEGIMMIFGKGDGKKIIGPIIIAAVLINFSLFFTKIIIDASNVVTVSFYNSISTVGKSETYVGILAGSSSDFSNAIMNAVNINSVFSSKSALSVITTVKPISNNTLTIKFILIAIAFLIVIFVFMAMIVLFVIRYLSFIILCILSPIGYVVSIIPGTENISDKYWNTLLGQAFFAPIFMIMMYITILVGTSFTTSFTISDAFNNPSVETSAGLLGYVLIIGLIIYSVIISKQFATQGGLGTKEAVNHGLNLLGGAVFGGSAALGRNTVGRYSKSVTEDKDLQRQADLGNKGARARLWLANKGAKGSFDGRRSAAGEKIQDTTGVNFGKGIPFNSKIGEGGYASSKKTKNDDNKTKIDTIVDRYRKDKKWDTLAEYVYTLSPADQKYMYEKLSARDRVALDTSLDAVAATRVPPITSVVNILHNTLTLEEKEKTEKASREATRETKNKEQVNLIHQLVSANNLTASGIPTLGPINPGPPPHPYTYDELLQGTGSDVFAPKNARNINAESLNDPEVIKRLKPQHLNDIMANTDDLDDATIRNMTTIIETGAVGGVLPVTASSYQKAQFDFINKPANRDNWHI